MRLSVYLLIILLSFMTSCEVVTPSEEADILSLDRELRLQALELSQQTSLVILRNEEYSGRLNDLYSWRNSQELFKRFSVDYLRVNKVDTIESIDSRKLKDFFGMFEGERLVLYFSSHLSSDGNLILYEDEKLPLKLFASYLNELKVPTLLIFDTCYAKKLKRYLSNDLVSVFYTGGAEELVFDVRIKGQKVSLDKKFDSLRKYLIVVFGESKKTYSLFSLLFGNALIKGSGKESLGEVFEVMVKENEEVRQIFGMNKYSRMSFEDSAGEWGGLKLK